MMILFMTNFNSIKVQLKLQSGDEDNDTIYNFNSIKVQLKLKTQVKHAISNKFQFHKGTIKTDSIYTTSK